jgi:predicted dehydrogenase
MGPHEIRICLVGFGSIAHTHASALAALPLIRLGPFRPTLAAIVSERPAEVAAEAAALGVRVLSLENALAQADLDVFDVATRNNRHLEQATAILRAGRPLYLEKPIGRTPEEADALVAVGASGPISQVGLVTRYGVPVAWVRSMFRAGAIGELRQARVGLFHGSYLNPERAMSWRLRADQAGGGAMLDLGLHLIDVLRFLFGDLELLSGSSTTFVKDRPDTAGGRQSVDVEDWAWAEVRVAGGARATIEASRVAYGAEGAPLEVYGSEGSMVADLDSARPPALHRFDGREDEFRRRASADPALRAVEELRPPRRLTLGPFVDGHLAGLHHFLRRVEGDDPIPCFAPTLADSASAERLVAAILSLPS